MAPEEPDCIGKLKYLNKHFCPECDTYIYTYTYFFLLNIGTAQWDVQIKLK
jgi:hypothetical protein